MELRWWLTKEGIVNAIENTRRLEIFNVNFQSLIGLQFFDTILPGNPKNSYFYDFFPLWTLIESTLFSFLFLMYYIQGLKL